jgi:hypothetical protein
MPPSPYSAKSIVDALTRHTQPLQLRPYTQHFLRGPSQPVLPPLTLHCTTRQQHPPPGQYAPLQRGPVIQPPPPSGPNPYSPVAPPPSAGALPLPPQACQVPPPMSAGPYGRVASPQQQQPHPGLAPPLSAGPPPPVTPPNVGGQQTNMLPPRAASRGQGATTPKYRGFLTLILVEAKRVLRLLVTGHTSPIR